ncbi:hypothetical protein NRL14_08500 [Pseudoalteromonas sp. 20-92]|uniref:hypothetical protein n=1 Tax=Pseudoalteromonas sp. 20-92 TaxID=2969394 RepID=UPI0027AF2C4D|nr:hypothetical protein [Pseudoalteromonas sp. 20-92]MDQ2043765.1 hypothetical protein [Pseudoalteromonas sp. 20-92]
MNYLIASDIFGLTPAFTQFTEGFDTKVTVIDPYDNELQPIDSEEYNYNKFIQKCGHDKYTDKLQKCFAHLQAPTTCIAFSAGASAAWRAQLLTGNTHLKKLIGFYPSQIRNYLALDANVPCEFIFPKHEVHFNVDEVIAILNNKSAVKCNKTNYLHGFMNEHSVNYNEQAYNYFSHYLKVAL